jgi:cardiolipin synthase
MWRTADPPTRVQIPPRPWTKKESLGEMYMIRKKYFINIVLCSCLFAGLAAPVLNQPVNSASFETLLLNEIMFHPSENENTNEWIELYNPTAESIDVNGWMLADEKETDTLVADIENGDGSTGIPPGGYAIVTDTGTTIDDTFDIPDDAIRISVDDSTLCGYGLNNQQEKIILMNSEGTVVDAIEWGQDYEEIPGAPFKTVAKGNSLARYHQVDTDDSSHDFYECDIPTPGSQNIQTTPDEQSEDEASEDSSPEETMENLTSTILVVELYYDAHPTIEAEYIRLMNPLNVSRDISGWYLTDKPWKQPDDRPKVLFPPNTIIPPHTSWVIAKNASAYYWETVLFPDFEFAVDSQPTVPQLSTYRSMSFSDTGGLVGLYSASDGFVDLLSYGETTDYADGWEGPSIPSSGEGIVLRRNIVNGIWMDTNTATDWLHPRIYRIGQSDFTFDTITFTGEVTAFVSPDNSYEAIAQELKDAISSIDMNMYEFTNPFLYKDLVDALQRNVTIRIFMEGSPVGGIDDREVFILKNLAAHGALIRFIVSDNDNRVYARYPFNHGKYLIIDNETVIVESCNWAKTGVPKNSSYGNREWGIVIRNNEVASQFWEVFQEDWNPLHTDSYPIEAMNMTFFPDFQLDDTIPTGPYPPQFTAQTITSTFMITPVFSPDTSEQVLLAAIDAATSTIYIQQLYIYKEWGETLSPLVEHLVKKSEEGVHIQVILDYPAESDDSIKRVEEIKEYLGSSGILVKCISTEWSPFTTLHNKGMIIDNTTVLISSINWNEQSIRKNREAGVLITNEDIARYYASVFLFDWNLEMQYDHPSIVLWADYKYLVLIAVVICATFVLIARDWRKRKWT